MRHTTHDTLLRHLPLLMIAVVTQWTQDSVQPAQVTDMLNVQNAITFVPSKKWDHKARTTCLETQVVEASVYLMRPGLLGSAAKCWSSLFLRTSSLDLQVWWHVITSVVVVLDEWCWYEQKIDWYEQNWWTEPMHGMMNGGLGQGMNWSCKAWRRSQETKKVCADQESVCCSCRSVCPTIASQTYPRRITFVCVHVCICVCVCVCVCARSRYPKNARCSSCKLQRYIGNTHTKTHEHTYMEFKQSDQKKPVQSLV